MMTGMVPLLVLVLVVGALAGLLSRRSSTGYRKFQEGRVTGIAGRKGHGKTLFTVHELLRHVGTRQFCRECTALYESCSTSSRSWDEVKPPQECIVSRGKVFHRGHVATNGSLDLPAKLRKYLIHVDGWDDLFTCPHATLCAIDEAHLWAPAIQGKDGQLPERVRWLLSQCRKLHLEIVWVSQAVDRVALGLRRQTDEVGICRRGMFRQMRVSFFDPDQLGKMGVKALWVYRYRVTRRLAASYDTYELLMPEASLSRDSLDAQLVDAATLNKARTKGAPAPCAGLPTADDPSIVTAPAQS